MATFKGIVRPYKKEDGTYRVYIRVTNNREHRDLATPFYVTSEQITRGFKIKDQAIIDKVEDKIREYRENATKVGFVSESLGIDRFIELMNGVSGKIDFFDLFENYIEKLKKEHREGSEKAYLKVLKRLRKYNNDKPLYLSDITKKYMSEYFESLQDLKANTQILHIGIIKVIFRIAQKKYNNTSDGIILARYDVFDDIKLPQKESSRDNVIRNIEDMQKLIDEPYVNVHSYDFAKDMFILSFVCFGTNMCDWIRMTKSQYKDGIIYYRRKKTGRLSGSDVDMQIKVPEVGRIILDKYSGDKDWLIDFRGRARSELFTKYIHYYFAKIGLEEMPKFKNKLGTERTGYTFYASRHSMASYARNVCNVEYMTVNQMLNHSTPSAFKTTDAYLYKDFRKIWEANDKLLALFDWSFYLKQKKEDNSSNISLS